MELIDRIATQKAFETLCEAIQALERSVAPVANPACCANAASSAARPMRQCWRPFTRGNGNSFTRKAAEEHKAAYNLLEHRLASRCKCLDTLDTVRRARGARYRTAFDFHLRLEAIVG